VATAHEVTVPPQNRVRGDDQVQLPQLRLSMPLSTSLIGSSRMKANTLDTAR
jgi:hypothetical protein